MNIIDPKALATAIDIELKSVLRLEECFIDMGRSQEIPLQDYHPRAWASIYGAKQLLLDALMSIESLNK